MKRKTLTTIAVVCSVLALTGVVATAAVLNDQIDEVQLKTWDYEVATLDAEGDVDESEANVVTKDFITVNGLQIKVMEEAEISYEVFFYDEDEDFISKTESLIVDFDSSAIPEDAEFVKILITHEKDDEISWGEKNEYSQMLEVTHAR